MRVPAAALAIVAISATASAQMVSLTEAEALARVLPESAAVRRIRAQVAVAEADVAVARRLPNPRLTLSREAVAGVAEGFTLLTQPLPITGRRGLDVRAAEEQVRATALRARDLERRVRSDLRVAFAELVSAQQREAELTSTTERLRDLARVLAAREQEGEAAGFDRLRAEREVAELEAEAAVAAGLRASAQAALAAFFVLEVDPLVLRAVTGTPERRPLPPLEALLARAAAERGDLLALERDIAAARVAQRAARRASVPEPEVVVGTKTSDAGGGDTGSVLSLVVSIPLFDRNQGARARAIAREQEARATLELTRTQRRAEIAALRARVEQQRSALERYRTAAAAPSVELERIAAVSYEAGERSILELLDAYRAGATARVRLTDLDLALARAEIELAYASGWEDLR